MAVTYKMLLDLHQFHPGQHTDNLNNVKMVRFLRNIYQGYRQDVAYHNDLHGLDVAQMMYVMMKSGNLI